MKAMPILLTPEPTWGMLYWPIALWFVAVGMFGIPETIGLFTNVANTLSDFSRWELHEYAHEPLFAHQWYWWLSQGLFIVLCLWLVIHIWYDKLG